MTGQVVVRLRVTKVSITDWAIKTVKEVAERQKMKSLKVTGRKKTLILPADWIAGVDHGLDNNDEEEKDGDHNDWVDNVTENATEEERYCIGPTLRCHRRVKCPLCDVKLEKAYA